VTARFEAIDAEIRARLDRWRARIGASTCGEGCATCCQQPVAVSSGEALILLDALAVHPRGAALFEASRRQAIVLERLAAEVASGPDDALDRVQALGPCPLLDLERAREDGSVTILDGRCAVYGSRPTACRTLHAWHAPRYCRHPRYRIGTPAELFEIRDRAMLDGLRVEAELGRIPFWGHLPLMLRLLHEHRADYVAGARLDRPLDDRVSNRPTTACVEQLVAARLLVFPVAGTGDEILAELDADRRLHVARHADDVLRPHGQPRADLAESREALSPIPEDPADPAPR